MPGLLLLVIWAVACSVMVGCREGEGNPMSQNSGLTGSRAARRLCCKFKNNLKAFLTVAREVYICRVTTAAQTRGGRSGGMGAASPHCTTYTGSAQAAGMLEVLQGAPGRVFLSPAVPLGYSPLPALLSHNTLRPRTSNSLTEPPVFNWALFRTLGWRAPLERPSILVPEASPEVSKPFGLA